jgi:RNA polymerase sigma factor (sigma-70 family)
VQDDLGRIAANPAVVAGYDESDVVLGDDTPAHRELVKRIAYHLFRRRTYVDVDDLIQAGMSGLREALPGHERDSAKLFEDYASVLIRGAMLDFVRKSDWSLSSRRVNRHIA